MSDYYQSRISLQIRLMALLLMFTLILTCGCKKRRHAINSAETPATETRQSQSYHADSGVQYTRRVEFLVDSILDKQDESIKLLGGSVWALSRPSLALVTQDIIIVLQDIQLEDERWVKAAMAFVDGDEIIVRHVAGPCVTQSGCLTTVVAASQNGALLKLADGSVLSVAEYDRFHTELWLPPYRVLLTGNGMYLYNLKNAKRIWVSSVH